MNTFQYGTKTIVYTLRRTERATLAITVYPDMSIEVCAPQNAEDAAIERKLRKRATWILAQQRDFAQFHPRTPPRRYVTGETHLYLGRQYRLRVRAAETSSVTLKDGYFWINLPCPDDPLQVKALLNAWYRQRAEQWLSARHQECLPLIEGWGLPAPRLVARPMSRRWGSYSRTGIITLNSDLIRAPRACMDYVILHELCHLRHPNHTRKFYAQLESLMPDWKKQKLRLEKLLS